MKLEDEMGKHFYTFVILFLLSFSTLAHDRGGMTARFIPAEVKPGDLFELSVEMHRGDYGQFVLNITSHPRLHLVTRERVPPKLVNGRYHQEERLVLQALSSGPLTFSGLQVELIETNGTRTITFPDLKLNILPFAQLDSIESPQPLPIPESNFTSNSKTIVLLILFIIITGLFLYWYRNVNKSTTTETPRTKTSIKIATKDFETLLEGNRDTLSANLRRDLETFLYSPDRSGLTPADLKSRLRKELGE